MKKEELLEIIRTVVRDEINNTLPQFLMEVLAEKITAATPIIKAAADKRIVEGIRSGPFKSPVATLSEPAAKNKPVNKVKIITKNPALNAALAATVGGLPTQAEVESESALDKIEKLSPEALNENSAVAAVAKALTKNYSEILKATAEKARASRP